MTATNPAPTEYGIGVLFADRHTTNLLRNADMFERFKCVIDQRVQYFGLKPKDNPALPTIDDAMRKLVRTLQTHPECWPVALWCEETKQLWVGPEIKMISTGHKFGMLKDWLKAMELDAYAPLDVPDSKPNGTAPIATQPPTKN